MDRYVCIHGHFYQPPRENPWLEDVEIEDSAYPYHDWNQRITAECYEPNTASRILDRDGWIEKIVNNYSRISFDFGPTLLSWMEKKAPDVYRSILEADKESIKLFSGHGSAMAQAYNHMIMPLANSRDKKTQVIWGIKDFQHRFGRKPEGMWLPETAVDNETLEILAQQGIRFTVLAYYQAHRVRKTGSASWREVEDGCIDILMPYKIYLPESGSDLNVFFYNGEVSRAVAFERLLSNGERFASRLTGAFGPEKSGPALVNIATDGETYGHHHRHGDMALAYALHYIELNRLARVTNYSQFLELLPPSSEVEIKERTAWSCAHGVGRWISDCGCNTGLHPGWSQSWRAHIRAALDWLRDNISPLYRELAGKYFRDPWEARDKYIEVILDRSVENVDRWLAKNTISPPGPEDSVTILKLMEMQRHAMLMYTSCGWFFDDISGIETIQILKYAGRVVQLAGDLFDKNLEQPFLAMLEKAKSNDILYKDAANIYRKHVMPAMVDLTKVGAHYAICLLYETYDDHSGTYCYDVKREDSRSRLAGAAKILVGRAKVISQITRESATINFGVVNMGNHIVNCGVKEYTGEEDYKRVSEDLIGAFDRGDYPGVVRALDRYFGGANYSIKGLFRDKQRLIIKTILERTLAQATGEYQRIYDRSVVLMRFLRDMDIPQPRALSTAAEYVINTRLRKALSSPEINIEHIKELLGEASMSGVSLDGAGLRYVLERTIGNIGKMLYENPSDIGLAAKLNEVMLLVRELPFEVDLWKIQNIYYQLLQTVYGEYLSKARAGNRLYSEWIGIIDSLGNRLKIRRGK
ncbi:MAG: DUF3536 domain-containing protein [Bacillota bacterium]